MAAPKRKPLGNLSPLPQAHKRRQIAARLIALCIPAFAIGCREKLEAETAGGVRFALPAWAEQGRLTEPSNGRVERVGPRGERASIAWDMDPRPGPPAGAPHGQVDGHPAALAGGALVWRCDKTARLFRLQGPELERLAAEVRCHAVAPTGNGEVPAASSAVLGGGWRFGNRGRGSISWLRDDAVLTYFAGQQLPPPRDADAARSAAPAWAAAAGLADASADDARPADGPQGHPALLVHGRATLDGRPVRWSMLFWRCLQRQRTFTAIVFGQGPVDDGALLSARCHG